MRYRRDSTISPRRNVRVCIIMNAEIQGDSEAAGPFSRSDSKSNVREELKFAG